MTTTAPTKAYDYRISAGAIEMVVEADTAEEAVLVYVQDAGYASVEDAAEACSQTVERFLADVTVERL